MSPTVISEEEMAAQLRRIASGEVSLQAVGMSWSDVFAGDCELRTSDGWTIVVFNDCFEFDYVDRAESLDGRQYRFPDTNSVMDAVEMLSKEDIAELERIVSIAPVIDPVRGGDVDHHPV